MKAVTIPEFGDADALVLNDVEPPTAGPGEVLIDVVAAGVNRADVMQRLGYYPPPAGITDIPGLEVAGRIAAFGEGVDPDSSGYHIGEEVVALLSGGGYAEQVAVPIGQLMPRPSNLSLTEAAGFIETAATVWSNLFMTAHLVKDETVLLHGGSSGIGTTGIQIAKAKGAKVAVTAGSEAKLEACEQLGADILINYREQDFVEEVKKATNSRGADVILDVIGAKYLKRNVDALATDGRIVTIGLLGGRKGELDLGKLLNKRGTLAATSLRSRSVEGKSDIVRQVRENVVPLVETGHIKPVLHATFPLAQAPAAHRVLEESSHIGKVVLEVQ
ncbi:NAD(P)H-quinone oxidoreductase [Dermatophilus congolensis]|uniref:NAD(P)H-quinone oxidoreductase n=1 Tax=Dermatophilus congolensis TaxID=1863 RepID=UPI001AAF23D1|nr:NAD(P)H-quinone oxidoreductase [Dermatophilus congolensis]MBO3143571.1 NAD(P)H-quinone oxidoreductase [Dermatophilus congolensis]MBO3152563.1 NAD(P)H-quinone oxidoreductase [Dermatophilus congolensis]MBO3160426.1 NAD(P)H-quinone oxidoreductase [Dermatophilus congolensis]MBO3163848.1 NAD(P)H-quinone oxidoreductase [Dermatophilus congolensis]MBO3177395.1 NAD(P)H-quinone oxidoreductase [Dermatophilus congolensis]